MTENIRNGDNKNVRVQWDCSVCCEPNITFFERLGWNITRDQCNDVDGVFLFLSPCKGCGYEDTSIISNK